MSLRARLERLQRRYRPPRCERHDRPRSFQTVDWRAGLFVLHPLRAIRAVAEARQAVELARAARPCPDCGWAPAGQIAIRGVKLDHDGNVARDDEDDGLADDGGTPLHGSDPTRYTRAEALADELAYWPGALAFRAEITPEDDPAPVARLDATLAALGAEITRLEGASTRIEHPTISTPKKERGPS